MKYFVLLCCLCVILSLTAQPTQPPTPPPQATPKPPSPPPAQPETKPEPPPESAPEEVTEEPNEEPTAPTITSALKLLKPSPKRSEPGVDWMDPALSGTESELVYELSADWEVYDSIRYIQFGRIIKGSFVLLTQYNYSRRLAGFYSNKDRRIVIKMAEVEVDNNPQNTTAVETSPSQDIAVNDIYRFTLPKVKLQDGLTVKIFGEKLTDLVCINTMRLLEREMIIHDYTVVGLSHVSFTYPVSKITAKGQEIKPKSGTYLIPLNEDIEVIAIDPIEDKEIKKTFPGLVYTVSAKFGEVADKQKTTDAKISALDGLLKERESQLASATTKIQELEEKNKTTEEQLNTAHAKIKDLESAIPYQEVFRLKSGSLSTSYSANIWYDFPNATGTLNIPSQKNFFWMLNINGCYTSSDVIMTQRIKLYNDETKTTTYLPEENGLIRRMYYGSYYEPRPFEFTMAGIAQLPPGKYTVQFQFKFNSSTSYYWYSNEGQVVFTVH